MATFKVSPRCPLKTVLTVHVHKQDLNKLQNYGIMFSRIIRLMIALVEAYPLQLWVLTD